MSSSSSMSSLLEQEVTDFFGGEEQCEFTVAQIRAAHSRVGPDVDEIIECLVEAADDDAEWLVQLSLSTVVESDSMDIKSNNTTTTTTTTTASTAASAAATASAASATIVSPSDFKQVDASVVAAAYPSICSVNTPSVLARFLGHSCDGYSPVSDFVVSGCASKSLLVDPIMMLWKSVCEDIVHGVAAQREDAMIAWFLHENNTPFRFDVPSPDDLAREKRKNHTYESGGSRGSERRCGRSQRGTPLSERAEDERRKKAAANAIIRGSSKHSSRVRPMLGEDDAFLWSDERGGLGHGHDDNSGEDSDEDRRYGSRSDRLRAQRVNEREADISAALKRRSDVNKPHVGLCGAMVSVVTVGCSGVGKSTLLGQILVSLGHVSRKAFNQIDQMHRASVKDARKRAAKLQGGIEPPPPPETRHQSHEQRKTSSALAWITDRCSRSRATGHSMRVGMHMVRIGHGRKTMTNESDSGGAAVRTIDSLPRREWAMLIDTPGLSSRASATIAGIAQANVALLVVSAVDGKFERDHLMWCALMGIKHLVVAVTHMDRVQWRQAKFERACRHVAGYLANRDAPMFNNRIPGGDAKRDADTSEPWCYRGVRFVPVSATTANNIVSASDKRLMSWYRSVTLIGAIQMTCDDYQSSDEARRIRKLLKQQTKYNAALDVRRMCMSLSSVTRVSEHRWEVIGRIERAYVLPRDRIVAQPVRLGHLAVESMRDCHPDAHDLAVGMAQDWVQLELRYTPPPTQPVRRAVRLWGWRPVLVDGDDARSVKIKETVRDRNKDSKDEDEDPTDGLFASVWGESLTVSAEDHGDQLAVDKKNVLFQVRIVTCEGVLEPLQRQQNLVLRAVGCSNDPASVARVSIADLTQLLDTKTNRVTSTQPWQVPRSTIAIVTLRWQCAVSERPPILCASSAADFSMALSGFLLYSHKSKSSTKPTNPGSAIDTLSLVAVGQRLP